MAILSTVPWMLVGQCATYFSNRGEASADSLLGLVPFMIVVVALAASVAVLWARMLQQRDSRREAARLGLVPLAVASLLIPTVLIGAAVALVLLPMSGFLIGFAGTSPHPEGRRLYGGVLSAIAMGTVAVVVLSV